MVIPNFVFEAKKKKIPCILHWHEWEEQLSFFTKEQIRVLVDYPELIIANSQLTKDFLIKLGRTGKIEICYEPVNSIKIIESEYNKITKSSISIPEDSFVWLMSGAIDMRKNTSLFIEIANYLIKFNKKVYFMWIGGGSLLDSAYMENVLQKINYYGINDNIIWIEEQSELYYDYFNLADGFVSTASIETFSIVSAEALAFGIPYIGYDCGGTNEYITSEVGLLLNSNKPNVFYENMINIMNKNINFNFQKSKEIALKYDVSEFINRWSKILKNYINDNN
jgi:glycosyltransferase involved in cell wall biosynthesis